MAITPSTMMPLGTQAADFSLPNTIDGSTISLTQVRGDKSTLIMFICNHCPYVKHLQEALAQLGEYQARGVGIAAISSNDVINYPADAPDKMREFAQQNNFTFPYLYDETQGIARAYGAACTPDFFLFDGQLRCVYRGRFDDSTPGNNEPVTGKDLIDAIEATIRGTAVSEKQVPSMGCNIKWKNSI